MMRRSKEFLSKLGEKQNIHIRLHPKVIEATDSIAEACGTDRTSIIEIGLECVFRGFIEMVSEDTGVVS
jgi:hypothetical protein